MAHWPEIIDCPFLRIAPEYPDTAHPFHRLAIQHQNKIVDYLTDLLEPYTIDKKAAATAILSVIDGAFSIRMLYGNSKVVPILAPVEAVLKSFRARSKAQLTDCIMEASLGATTRMRSPKELRPGNAHWPVLNN